MLLLLPLKLLNTLNKGIMNHRHHALWANTINSTFTVDCIKITVDVIILGSVGVLNITDE